MSELSPFLKEKMEALCPSGLYSSEAEKAVLGCMMAQPAEVIDEAILSLLKEDFFVPAHQEIFGTLREMHNTHQAIDLMTIHQWLTDRKMAEAVGSPGILAELSVGFATHLNIGSYIRIVKDKSLLRCLQLACSAIVTDIADMPDSVPAVLDRAEKMICAITQGLSTGHIWNAEACVRQFEQRRGRIQAGELDARLKTGLRALDEANGGLPVPSYVVIGGEQGVGKSAIILNIMRHACQNGVTVGGFSMEMTLNQIVQRQVADLADINSRRFNDKLHPQEEVDMAYALEKIRKMSFHLDPTAGLRPHDIRVGTRKMVKLGCKIIWLDNAQLMSGSNDRDQRNQQLTEFSRTIQELQKEHEIVFILLAQVTREAQKRGNLRTFDLADCAAFERDARVMIMLEKKPESEGAPSYSFPIMIRVVKYSEGETGDFEATFNKAKQRIS